MSYYKKNLKWGKNTCRIAKEAGDNIISLPMQPTLTRKKINYICDKVCEFFQT